VKGTGNSRFNVSEKLVVEIAFKKGKREEIYENGNHQVSDKHLNSGKHLNRVV
jgi:hypothetical protein